MKSPFSHWANLEATRDDIYTNERTYCRKTVHVYPIFVPF